VTHPSKLPIKDTEELQIIIDELCAVLEARCGDNMSAWGATTMVLLKIIVDISGADMNEIAEQLKDDGGRFLQ
jgi:hypothetical protein